MDAERIVADYLAGHGGTAIARMHEVGEKAVYRILKRAGVSIRPASETLIDRRCGPDHPRWKGGKRFHRSGYIHVSLGGNRRKAEHVLIAEKALGKPLPAGAIVHHVNRNRGDNRNENLVICQDQTYHKLLHTRMDVRDAGGDPNTGRLCTRCRLVKEKLAFSRQAKGAGGLHTLCRPCASIVFAEWKARRK